MRALFALLLFTAAARAEDVTAVLEWKTGKTLAPALRIAVQAEPPQGVTLPPKRAAPGGRAPGGSG